MRWTVVFILSGFASLSAAHGSGLPRLAGSRKFLSELKGRRKLEEKVPEAHVSYIPDRLTGTNKRDDDAANEPRDNTSGECGPDQGTCAAGWCGTGIDYCEAPDCQLDYGPGCDGNQKPSGVDTSSIVRTKLGEVEYGGVGIYDCVNEGDIAMTFDDGPWNYTSDLLDKLKTYGAKATFFIAGNNIGKGMINDPDLPWKAVIQRMAEEGHQVASHTWSHQNFSAISSTQAQNQMIWNEIALNDILGYIPTYMRPPFSICERACQTMLSKLGYHIIYFDLDTEGYLNDDPNEIQNSKDIWDETIDGSDSCDNNYLHIEHDIHWQTVYNLTDYFLTSLFDNGYRSVTVGECLGDPPENWYRAGSSPVPTYTFPVRSATGLLACEETSTANSSKRTTTPDPAPTGSLVVSTDGNCGSGFTCADSTFGNCCSQHGWCGSTTDYCGDGCQPDFGSGCLSSSSSAATSTSTSTPTSTSATFVTSTTSVTSSTSSRTSMSTSKSTSKSTSTSKPTSTTKTTTVAPTPSALVPSKDGSCGTASGYTCLGSSYGLCCTLKNHCALLCLAEGCQPEYGTCAILIGLGDEEQASGK
ncbi:putative Chitin deacetylase [Seiridium cardinale]